MRFLYAAVVCAGLACAQAVPEAEVTKAAEELEQLRGLVEAGAAPRAELERAQERLADAQDAALLRHTLYGRDLTEERIPAMLDAARNRLERRQRDFDRQQKLIAAGVSAARSLDPLREELGRARDELALAESRGEVCRELTAIAAAEKDLAERMGRDSDEARRAAQGYPGAGAFTATDFERIETAFNRQFAHDLPVSAVGETAVHRALGFDHRGRVDVALHPDDREGAWLLHYLEAHRIPYFAFRQAVPGKATGAHIHIGPMSTRIAGAGAGAGGA